MDESLRSLQRRQSQLVRRIIAAMGWLSLLVALWLYAFADRIGLDPDTARLLVTVFVIAGVLDGLAVRFWDRIFKGN